MISKHEKQGQKKALLILQEIKALAGSTNQNILKLPKKTKKKIPRPVGPLCGRHIGKITFLKITWVKRTSTTPSKNPTVCGRRNSGNNPGSISPAKLMKYQLIYNSTNYSLKMETNL